MSFATALLIILLVAITTIRGIINAKIFNNLHDMDIEMFVNAEDTTPKEIDKSSESLLFAIYCALVIIWFKFKKEDLKYVIYNYLLSLLTAVLIVGYFVYFR